MKKKLIAVLLLLCTVVLTLSSCGDFYDYDLSDYLSVKEGFDYTKVSVKQKDIDEKLEAILKTISLSNGVHILDGKETVFTVTAESIKRVEEASGQKTETLWSTVPTDVLSGMVIKLDYVKYTLQSNPCAEETVSEAVKTEILSGADQKAWETVGLKLGESVRYATRLPADYKTEALRGKLIVYDIVVTGITRKQVAITDPADTVKKGDEVAYTYTGYLANEAATDTVSNMDVTVGTTELPASVKDQLTKSQTATEKVYFFAGSDQETAGLYTLFVSEATLTSTVATTTTVKHYYTKEKAEALTETVKKGDVVHLVYNGYLLGDTALITVDTPVSATAAEGATGMESVLIGTAVGGTARYATVLPDDYADESLRGAKIVYVLTLTSVSRGGTALTDTKETVKAGDAVTYTYKGYLPSDTPFEGASAKAEDLTVGSGNFSYKVEGFEEQLIGMELVASRDIPLGFPKEYLKSSVQSGALDDKLVIRPKHEDLTIEQINAFNKKSDENAVSYATRAEWEQKTNEESIKSLVSDAMTEAITVVTFPKDEVITYAERMISEAEMYASYYGMTLSKFLASYGSSMYGATTNEQLYDMAIAWGQNIVRNQMILLYIARQQGMTVTKDDLNLYCETYYADNGYESAKAMLKEVGKDEIELNTLCDMVASRFLDWAVIVPTSENA